MHDNISSANTHVETTLVVARHGNTFNKGDVILRVGARTDLPLTEEGRAQGRRLGERLAERGLIPTSLYSAPLRRTLETTSELAATLRLDLEPRIEDFLLELDYGEDDGRPENEVARRLGAAETARDTAATPEELETLGKATLQRWDREKRLPKGWAFLQSRVDSLENNWRSFARQIVEREPGGVVVATTSNGVARFSLAILEDATAQAESSFKLSTGAFGVFVWNGERWRLDAWNVR